MSSFSVPDMSCGHCSAAITTALEAQDPTVEIEADIEAREVDVFTSLDDETVLKTLKQAGYPAQLQS